MDRVIAFHSFRRGTGKTSLLANIAYLMASQGQKVGVIDADIQSPGLQLLLGLPESDEGPTLLDVLWERCDVEQAVRDLTGPLGISRNGRLYLVPSSSRPVEIARALRAGYDFDRFSLACGDLVQALDLDVLLLDAHAGIYEETLLTIARSDTLAVILRLDRQDFQGTAVIVDVARELEVPRVRLIANQVPAAYDQADVNRKLTDTYRCPVSAVLPHDEQVSTVASSGLYAAEFPSHSFTGLLRQAASNLVL
jgi:MinD-like ATPase involved in chromosome partitioning or flagellar assembly